MNTGTTILTVIAGIIALIAGYVYFFGIPPELKREMEEKALKTMGENKASYLMKGKYQLCNAASCQLALSDTASQIKSPRSPKATSNSSRTSSKVSRILAALLCKILWASLPEIARTTRQSPSPAASNYLYWMSCAH